MGSPVTHEKRIQQEQILANLALHWLGHPYVRDLALADEWLEIGPEIFDQTSRKTRSPKCCRTYCIFDNLLRTFPGPDAMLREECLRFPFGAKALHLKFSNSKIWSFNLKGSYAARKKLDECFNKFKK